MDTDEDIARAYIEIKRQGSDVTQDESARIKRLLREMPFGPIWLSLAESFTEEADEVEEGR